MDKGSQKTSCQPISKRLLSSHTERTFFPKIKEKFDFLLKII